jgi:uncharacterized phage protein (TIGR02216 family)
MSELASLPEPFPWAAAMRFGLGRLRLSPQEFWSMTPLELVAAAEGYLGVGAPTLGLEGLQHLMRQFPDHT